MLKLSFVPKDYYNYYVYNNIYRNILTDLHMLLKLTLLKPTLLNILLGSQNTECTTKIII